MQRSKPQRIDQLQARALKNNQLDLIGMAEEDFEPISLDAVTATLYDVAEEYMLLVKRNLIKSDHLNSGALEDSIIPSEVIINGSAMTINISVLKYYKFVDKGVKGWQSGGGNSPYKFKKPGPRGGGGGSSKFVTSIRKWLIREGLSQRAKEVGHAKSKSRDAKRKNKSKFTDTSTRTAIIIAANIRRRGLKPSGFWTNAEKEMRGKIKSKFSAALKIDVINNLI